MSDDIKQEIIDRAKRATVLYGRQITPENREVGRGIYSLIIDDGETRVWLIWVEFNKNLRIRATLRSLGHLGSKSVLDFYEDRGINVWNYEGSNEMILTALRKMMLLEDIADV
ncbi:MAG: hypothetical protein AB7L09_01740 [Nitrospira sp.]